MQTFLTSIKSWMVNNRLVNKCQVSITNCKSFLLNCHSSKNCSISKKLQIGLILEFIGFKVSILYLKSCFAACTLGKNTSVFCVQIKKKTALFEYQEAALGKLRVKLPQKYVRKISFSIIAVTLLFFPHLC